MSAMNRTRSRRRRLAVAGALGLAAAGIAGLGAHRSDAGGPVGPDVVVFGFTDIGSNGVADGFAAYAVGTWSCNRGDAPLNWCNNNGDAGCGLGTTDDDHPVIAQNLYRLKGGRFEQIGQSWLKHGFLSTNTPQGGCTGAQGQGCTGPPLGGDQLGIGCTDPYHAGLNAQRPLGRRSEVNAATGDFPYPYSSPGGPYAVYDQRVKVAVADVDPAQNAGALYFAEAQYVAPDDATQGNGLNNASHERVTVGGAPNYALAQTGAFREQQPAILAWQEADKDVQIVDVDVPASSPLERFIAAREATDLGGGMWHYEYAIHNLNSDRGGRSFTVAFAQPATIANVGFHDIDAHSGEPYSTADWAVSTDAASVTWSTDDFSTDPDANALRWATLYSFRFDADRGPADVQVHTLGLFKAGSPTSVDFDFPATDPTIFTDGFESGDTSAWSATVP
jgi:hypothetical protein